MLAVEDASVNASQPADGAAFIEEHTRRSMSGAAAEESMKAVSRRQQTRKDPKSLGQNLYDTVTMSFAYYKQIPNAEDIFASLRSSSGTQHVRSEHRRISEPTSAANNLSHLAASTGCANGHTVAPTVNGTHMPDDMDQSSLIDGLKSPPTSDPPHIMSKVLSNGDRIHRIRHHLIDSAPNGHARSKSPHPSSFDGISDKSPEKPKMKSKFIPTENHNLSNKSATTRGVSPTKNEPVRQSTAGEPGLSLPATAHLTCDILDQFTEIVHNDRTENSSYFDFVIDSDTKRTFRTTVHFINRSIFYGLSDPETLLKSFREQNPAYKDSPLPHLNASRLTHAFRDWNNCSDALVVDSLWIAAEALFNPPPELDTEKSPRLKPSRKDSNSCPPRASHTAAHGRYLSTEEAAHIVMVCVHALTSLVPMGWTHTWVQLRQLRSWGVVVPNSPPPSDPTYGFADPWLNIVDELEYEPAIRLADRLFRGIGARICFEHILATLDHRGSHTSNSTKPNGKDSTMDTLRDFDVTAEPDVRSPLLDILVRHLAEVERVALENRRKLRGSANTYDDPGWTVTAAFMEWMRTIIVKQWDGKAEINKWSSVGTAVTLLGAFRRHHVETD